MASSAKEFDDKLEQLCDCDGLRLNGRARELANELREMLPLLTPFDKDALAEKTSCEKLKAMMESEEGWIAPDKVAEHDAEILGIRDREWIEALGFDFQPENEIPALIVNESRGRA